MVVHWHQLDAVEMSAHHIFLLLAIFVPKIIKVGGHLTKCVTSVLLIMNASHGAYKIQICCFFFYWSM